MDRLANQDGLNLIKVQKAELLQKLLDNREAHVAEYNEALEGFKKERIRELEKFLVNAIEEKEVPQSITFDVPKSHESDYTTVIEMLEMSVDEEIYITMQEFRQYVQDKWSWKGAFSLTNSKYIGG